MEFTALVTLLLLAQYLAFAMLVGRERVRHGIEAPACSGHPDFDRAYRVQMNTLEQLVIVLPALWITAWWFTVPLVAPLLGLGFFLVVSLHAKFPLQVKTKGTGKKISECSY